MDLLQEYKEIYYKELELKEILDGKIRNGMTFLTILGSAQILLWSQLKKFSWSLNTQVYLGLCIATTLCFLISTVFFFISYTGYDIHYIPISDIYKQNKRVIENANEQSQELAMKSLDDALLQIFIETAIHNRELNLKKADHHKHFIYVIVVAFALTAITFADGIIVDYKEFHREEETTMSDDKISAPSSSPQIIGKDGSVIQVTPYQPQVINETSNLHDANKLYWGSNENNE